MNFVKLSDALAVAGQIQPQDVAAIAAQGYKVVVNNRPDGEQPGQPGSDELAAVVAQAGLEYHYMPVGHSDFPGADFESFSQMIDNPDKPVSAFCRSGPRCPNLWVASRPQAEVEAAAELAQRSGFDLGFAAQYFSRQRSS